MEDGEGITSIDVSFMELLLGLEYDRGEEASTVGATYKQLYKIGHQVGFGKRQMRLWVKFCSYLPLSQKMATHLISGLADKERETEEAKRLIGEALQANPEVFETIDNAQNPANVTFKGDQITPAMVRLIKTLIDLNKEDFVQKEELVTRMDNLHGHSAHSTNGLLYQLKKRGYIEERRADPAFEGLASSRSYRLEAEFREFLREHDLNALIREHLRPG